MSHTLASDESARPVSATSVTPRRRSAGMMALSSLDSPEFEISRQMSPEVTMPRSPCAASAGCTKNDGVPRVARDASFSALLQEMSTKGLGLAAIVDGHTPVGIFTDGDLRRLIETGADLRQRVAHEVMHPRPHLIRAGALAVDAADLMERHRITSLLVVDGKGELVGALNTYDLLRAKVI